MLCHCDKALRGGYCREKMMAHLLRCLFFLEEQHDLTLTAEYIRESDNGAADAISRNQLDVFATGPSKADPSKSERGGEVGNGYAMDLIHLEVLVGHLVDSSKAP